MDSSVVLRISVVNFWLIWTYTVYIVPNSLCGLNYTEAEKWDILEKIIKNLLSNCIRAVSYGLSTRSSSPLFFLCLPFSLWSAT